MSNDKNVEIITNPDNVPGSVVSGYQQQNIILGTSITGYVNVGLLNGIIVKGSIFEINGSLFVVNMNEPVQEIGAIPSNNFFYIYAKLINRNEIDDPNDPDLPDYFEKFYASTTAPVWIADKGGYYCNEARALLKAIKNFSGVTGVLTLSHFFEEAGFIFPVKPSADGTLTESLSGYQTKTRELDRGWYRVVLKAGGGGGGLGNNGYEGGPGGSLNEKFYVPYNGVKCKLMSGAGGGNNGSGGGGGGGGSVLDIPELGILFIATGGRGGGLNDSGGGGGGGYGGGGCGYNYTTGGNGGNGGGCKGGSFGQSGSGSGGGSGGTNNYGGATGGCGGEGGYKSAGYDGGNNVNNMLGGGGTGGAYQGSPGGAGSVQLYSIC